jgi:hypothetical protein
MDTSKKQDKSTEFKKVQFGQHVVPRKMVEYIYKVYSQESGGKNWLDGVLPPRLERLAFQQISDLHVITRIGRRPVPNKGEILLFAEKCREMPWSIAMTWPPRSSPALLPLP